jgi:hypothetical protein
MLVSQRSLGARPGSSLRCRRWLRDGADDRVDSLYRLPVGSAPVTHLDQERSELEAPCSLALGVPQKTVGSRPCPGVEIKSRGSRVRVQPPMARDQGASAGSLEEGRRLPLKSAGFRPDPYLGSAASAHIYPNARPIWNGT